MRKSVLIVATLSVLLTGVFHTNHVAAVSPRSANLLAAAPAPVGEGASIAAVMGLVGAPIDWVFALRGGGSRDFWRYSISANEWSTVSGTPSPVGDGAGIVEVHSFVDCGSEGFRIAAIRGGNTRDFWFYNMISGGWCFGPDTPAAVGAGGAIAQLQRLGKIYVLRGNGSSDFWEFRSGQWSTLASTPGPVGPGGGLVGINYGTHSQKDVLYALQGGGSSAVWKYDVDSGSWSFQSNAPEGIGAGGAVTSPNVGGGDEGTLNVLSGGGSSSVWSLDIAADHWTMLDVAPGTVTGGGATSSQFNGCDLAFVGGGSNAFFSTGQRPCVLAPSPADYSLSVDQPTIYISPGQKVNVKVTIVPSGGYTGAVTISVPPTDLSKKLKLPPDRTVMDGDTASFKIKVKASAQPGFIPVAFVGIDASNRVRIARTILIVQ